jgi:hypothetical protein
VRGGVGLSGAVPCRQEKKQRVVRSGQRVVRPG